MGRIANKKTGKLNKAYRDQTVFYSPSRGRKRNPWKSTRRKRKNISKPNKYIPTSTPTELSPKERKGCLLVFLYVVILIAVIVFVCNLRPEKETNIDKIVTLEQLQSATHPKVADNKENIKDYYKDFVGVGFEHSSDFKSKKTNPLTWHYTSTYGDNTYNDIVIDFSLLSEEEQKQLTFDRVLDIAISFVPVEEIIEYYTFDKAIYVERENHISHETNWYDFVYDTNPIVGKPTTEEELMAHQEWLFSLEDYINS